MLGWIALFATSSNFKAKTDYTSLITAHRFHYSNIKENSLIVKHCQHVSETHPSSKETKIKKQVRTL